MFSSEGNALNILGSVAINKDSLARLTTVRAESGKEDECIYVYIYIYTEYLPSWGLEHRSTRPLLELSGLLVRRSPRFKFDPNKGQPILVMVMTQACCLVIEVHVCMRQFLHPGVSVVRLCLYIILSFVQFLTYDVHI